MGYLKYLKLMNRMNAVTQVPQPPVPQFEQFCRLFVTDEEYDIMMGMKLRGNTEAELRALYTGSDWAGTLYDMCRKGFLLKIYDGAEPTFDLAPMLPGWFEFPLSTGEDNETLQKASELFTSAINMVTTLNVEANREDCSKISKVQKAHKSSTFEKSLTIRTFTGRRHKPPYLLNTSKKYKMKQTILHSSNGFKN